MKVLVAALVLALCVLHHDIWWWDSPAPGVEGGLVFGFMPIGLAWHTGISIAASLVWALAIRFCWPDVLQEDLEEQSA